MLFLQLTNCILIRTLSGRFITNNNQTLLTTLNPDDATSFTLEESDSPNEFMIKTKDNKVFDNFSQDKPGQIYLFRKHGKENQRFSFEKLDDRYLIKQKNYILVYNRINDKFNLSYEVPENGEEEFYLFNEDGLTLFYIGDKESLNNQQFIQRYSSNEDSFNSQGFDDSFKLESNLGSESNLRSESNFKSTHGSDKFNDHKTINLFIIQKSEPNSGFLAPIPLFANHTAFSGRRNVCSNGVMRNVYFTPKKNSCHISDGDRGFHGYRDYGCSE